MKTFKLQKGFTLIELLVVIGILSILVVGLIVAINPQDKLNAAGDARVINDTGALARAAEAYATSNSGAYPTTTTYATFTTGLTGSGDLKVAPTQPNGYGAYLISADGTGFMLVGQLKSNKYTNTCTTAPNTTGFIRYRSTNGQTCYGCINALSSVTTSTATAGCF
jgi:prepilin-type N-terminal cleavage/methylation domain-containing protein